MLKKVNRAGTKEVERIFREGRFLNSTNLTFKYILNQGKERKISFIAPKSVAKLAVKRNSLRRKGYTILRKYIDHFPIGIVAVCIFKKYQEDISILENEIKGILNKIN